MPDKTTNIQILVTATAFVDGWIYVVNVGDCPVDIMGHDEHKTREDAMRSGRDRAVEILNKMEF